MNNKVLECEKCKKSIYDLDGKKIFFCVTCKIKWKQFKDITKKELDEMYKLIALMKTTQFIGKITWGAIFLFMLEWLDIIEFNELFIILFFPLILAAFLLEIIARLLMIPAKKAKLGFDLIHGDFTGEELAERMGKQMRKEKLILTE